MSVCQYACIKLKSFILSSKLASAPPMMWLHHLLPPLLLLLHPGTEAEEVIRLSLRMRS
ncbi:hypothetical protein COCON_G00045690 [Conger conger]|uniref:Uncharacterized protein n=1 Tax=Conger conger TaxID=82655 RepID=A0A9Q1DUI4_CONCO|nr:hypothetical protein COCON_G00045690 [Conger conger]